jgi:Protein of unknown function (DUF2786)
MSTQSSELDRVKNKIRALAAKTVDRGATEEEALSAMRVVGKLLLQYDLSMNELEVRDATYKTIYLDTGRSRRGPMDGFTVALAELFGCKSWLEGGRSTATYAFFGQVMDLEFVEYLFKVIHSAIEAAGQDYRNSAEFRNAVGPEKRLVHSSFQKGMVARIKERLRAMKKSHDTDLAAASTGTALMVLRHQLVEEAFGREGIKLRMTYSYARSPHAGAYSAGRKAGGKVNLSRPLKGNGAVRGHLK